VVGKHVNAHEMGGLSGAPLKDMSTEIVRQLAQALNGQIPIIAVGGILSANDAQEKFEAGASLVQLYTGLIYRGATLISDIVNSR
jgi:dihydroorotate dehydrogenase